MHNSNELNKENLCSSIERRNFISNLSAENNEINASRLFEDFFYINDCIWYREVNFAIYIGLAFATWNLN